MVFFLLISGTLARKLGFQYLFLDPEYMGNVNFWSFFFVGLGFGSFFMSWNLAIYLLSAHYFPFRTAYGDSTYWVLAAVMCLVGVASLFTGAPSGSQVPWVIALGEIIFGVWLTLQGLRSAD